MPKVQEEPKPGVDNPQEQTGILLHQVLEARRKKFFAGLTMTTDKCGGCGKILLGRFNIDDKGKWCDGCWDDRDLLNLLNVSDIR